VFPYEYVSVALKEFFLMMGIFPGKRKTYAGTILYDPNAIGEEVA
jgi:hypothetical protein